MTSIKLLSLLRAAAFDLAQLELRHNHFGLLYSESGLIDPARAIISLDVADWYRLIALSSAGSSPCQRSWSDPCKRELVIADCSGHLALLHSTCMMGVWGSIHGKIVGIRGILLILSAKACTWRLLSLRNKHADIILGVRRIQVLRGVVIVISY